jgi:TolB-like protein/tetratricopeptide (TPR) repeat protein
MERPHETEKEKEATLISEVHLTKKDSAAPPASRRLPKWSLAAAGLFLVLATGGAFFSFRPEMQNDSPSLPLAPQNGQTALSDKNALHSAKPAITTLSIAVLPFKTVDAKTEDEQYLGVGTADLVTSKLSQITEINLRSASSVRRYLKSEKPPTEIGKELAVDYVVSGSIQRKNEDVEAKLEMTETASGRVVWSEIFDEPNNNLFMLQDSISELIAKSLRLRLTTTEKQNLAKHFTENGKAQQLYLAGRYHFGKRTVEGLRQAISLFEQAIESDPNFALAFTGLADCHGLLNWYQEPTPPDAWEKAKQAALKAVALDDNLAEAHSSLAFIKFHYERDYVGSENEFRRAINLKPNYATAHQWYAFLLATQARHNEAIAVMRHAEELEPRSAVIANAVANVLFLARLYDESIAQAKRSLEIDPTSVGAHVILRWNYEKKEAHDEALAIYEKEVAFAGDTPTSRAKKAHVLAAVGREDEARQILDSLFKNNQIENITPYEIAVIYSLLDERTKSIEWLKKAKDQHAVGFSFVRVDPLLDNVRGDKRFENLIQ